MKYSPQQQQQQQKERKSESDVCSIDATPNRGGGGRRQSTSTECKNFTSTSRGTLSVVRHRRGCSPGCACSGLPRCFIRLAARFECYTERLVSAKLIDVFNDLKIERDRVHVCTYARVPAFNPRLHLCNPVHLSFIHARMVTRVQVHSTTLFPRS